MTAPSVPAGDVAKLVEELRQVAVGLMNQASRDWDEQEEVIPVLRMLGHLGHEAATALEALSRERDHWLREAQRLLKSGQDCLDRSESLSRDLADARAAEREACAKLCETLGEADPDKEDHLSDYLAGFSSGYEAAAENFAAAIRARSVLSTQPKETPDG